MLSNCNSHCPTVCSHNNLTSIDKSIRLAPMLTELNLAHNSIEEVTTDQSEHGI